MRKKIITPDDEVGFKHAQNLQKLLREIILAKGSARKSVNVFLIALRANQDSAVPTETLLATHAVLLETLAMRAEGLIE